MASAMRLTSPLRAGDGDHTRGNADGPSFVASGCEFAAQPATDGHVGRLERGQDDAAADDPDEHASLRDGQALPSLFGQQVA